MITLIAPNIVMQKGDFFGTGIPYLPITLSYLASYLRSKKHEVQLIDAFGENPFKITKLKKHYSQGLTFKETVNKINKDADFIILSAERLVAHESIMNLLKGVKKKYPQKKVIIIENTQAVTAYSLKKVYVEFFKNKADYIVLGEPEYRVEKLLDAIKFNRNFDDIDGLIYKNNGKIVHNEKKEFIKEVDELPFPAWDLFPMKNYWKLGYAHAPLTSGKYLPLLTSRGCPYPCTFCVIPDTNKQRWRARNALNVVDEIEFLQKEFNVNEFHLEDLNPTIRKDRIVEICKEIIKRKLDIRWKISSGTKVETVDKNTIEWMAKAGCNYISISPETGSLRILKLMKKPFNHSFGREMIELMNKLKITSQACFVLGYPTENEEDRKLTVDYVRNIAKSGVDEIALFILTPAPGSAVYQDYNKKISNLSQLTFSPTWRDDYEFYHKFRKILYTKFFLWKFMYQPVKTFKMIFSFLTRRFNTKIEMTMFRVLKVSLMSR